MEIDGLFAEVEKQKNSLFTDAKKQRLFSAYQRTQQFHILSTLTFFFQCTRKKNRQER